VTRVHFRLGADVDHAEEETDMSDRRPRAYAGIGARRTPADVLDLMRAASARLARAGWMLRSGGAEGADRAFEAGAASVDAEWETYRVDGGWCALADLTPGGPTREAFELAASVHPAWSRCSERAKALHARNCHQILGADLGDPASFVICWTPDGSLDGAGREAGGTGQALRVAALHSIPVFNLRRPDHRARLESYL
jgi:hypothetical protein